jgi:hypothetical protein
VCRADAGECDVAEHCDGAGACPADSFEPAGFACGSNSDTVCDNPDTCNATGACQVNNEDYYFNGFFQPVDNKPVFNMGKAGRTFPIKWRLPDCNTGVPTGGYITDVGVVTNNPLTYKKITCPGGLTVDAMEEEAATSGSTVLRYDFTDNQFIFNWKTSSTFVNMCYELSLKLNNGMTQGAYFKFTK